MSTNCRNNLLGQQLLDKNLINDKELKKALKIHENTNKRLSIILQEERIVNGRELYKILSNLMNNPNIDNYNSKVKDEIDFELLDSFDPRVLIEKQFLPLNLNKDILKILVKDFKNKSIDKYLKTKFGDILIEKVEVSKNIINYFIEYSYKDQLIDEEFSKLIKEDNQPQKVLFTKGQLIFIGVISIAILTGIFFKFIFTINFGLYVVNIFFVMLILFKYIFPIFDNSQKKNKNGLDDEFEDENQNELPIYTVLVPLINNKVPLDNLILSLKNMNYPSNKMEVIFLLKYNDKRNRKNLLSSKLPENWKVIEVTKSILDKGIEIKNLGLSLAMGQYITTYTPKDLPETNQLKKVVAYYNKNSKDCFCLLAPYKYIYDNSFLSKYVNFELNQTISSIQSKTQFYNKLSTFIKGTRHYKSDKLRKFGGWNKRGETYLNKKNNALVTEVFHSITYSVRNYNGINFYRKQFQNSIKELLYYNRNSFNKIKHNYKELLSSNFILFTNLLTPLFYAILGLVLILKLFVDNSILNQYYLDYIVNISIGNLVVLYLLNFYFIIKTDSSIELKVKIKMSLFNPIFMIIKFYVLIKAIMQIIKNPYKLEDSDPELHRDLMFMYINFKNKQSD